MSIFCNDIVSISNNCAIDKFVVVSVSRYKSKPELSVYSYYIIGSKDCFYCNLGSYR